MLCTEKSDWTVKIQKGKYIILDNSHLLTISDAPTEESSCSAETGQGLSRRKETFVVFIGQKMVFSKKERRKTEDRLDFQS